MKPWRPPLLKNLVQTRADDAPDMFQTLPARDDRAGPMAEAIRALRTRVMAQHVDQGEGMIAVCGATPGVGCSFIAANLAYACAQIGVETLLVDADLRQPSLGARLMLGASKPGLTDYLGGADMALDALLQPIAQPHLTVIAAGQPTDSPQELLASRRFGALMRQVRDRYELVIVDTTPTQTCTDALRVARVAGHALVVARKHHSFMSDITLLARLLRADQAKILGTVLTSW